MKPFNLEEAKKGKPVMTRDGRPARIICWDRKKKDYPIIALIGVEEDIASFTTDGRYISCEQDPNDLFMASEKKEGWMNIYRCDTYKGREIYYTEEDAISIGSFNPNYITTIKVEWEE